MRKQRLTEVAGCMVAHACNLSYLGGSWEDHTLKPALAKNSRGPISMNKSGAGWHMSVIPDMQEACRKTAVQTGLVINARTY
jgi:hypothetical protein